MSIRLQAIDLTILSRCTPFDVQQAGSGLAASADRTALTAAIFLAELAWWHMLVWKALTEEMQQKEGREVGKLCWAQGGSV